MKKNNLDKIKLYATTKAEVDENVKYFLTKVIEKIPLSVSDKELKDLFNEIVNNFSVYWKKYRENT